MRPAFVLLALCGALCAACGTPVATAVDADAWRDAGAASDAASPADAAEEPDASALADASAAPDASCIRKCSGRACGDDGCGGLCGDCADGAYCDTATGACVPLCQPGTSQCSPDGTSLWTCRSDGLGWETGYCAITGKCTATPEPACVPPECTPLQKRCQAGSTTILEICGNDGLSWLASECTRYDKYSTPEAICRSSGSGGDCYDPCGSAARDASNLGCEFWAAVTSNSLLDSALFKGGAADGDQPDSPSEFGVVVYNPNPDPVDLKVTRKKAGVEAVSPSDPAADPNGLIRLAAGASQVVKLPWQSIAGTGQAAFAYHLTASLPVAATQFNPVAARAGSSHAGLTGGHTSDASMLLPAHALRSGYVVAAHEHLSVEGDSALTYACASDVDCPGEGNSCQPGTGGGTCAATPSMQLPAFFAVAAPQDGTQVSVRFAAATVASKNGVAVAAQSKGSTATYLLGRHDVLQFWSAVDPSNPTPAECSSFADPTKAGWAKVCRYDSDLTGTLVWSSDSANPLVGVPIAVFSGADCAFQPFGALACDHLEEMLLPVSALGRSYIAAKSPPFAQAGGAPVASPAPDSWRVVTTCSRSACPNGTKVRITPAPAAFGVPPGFPSISCAAGECTLPPIDSAKPMATAPWIRFEHAGSFTLVSDQQVLLAQSLTGQGANDGAAEGDPSLALAPPVEQWRFDHSVIVSPTFLHNFLALATLSPSPRLKIDGVDVTTVQFPGLTIDSLAGGNSVYRVPVAAGPHTVTGYARSGVTVYGYDTDASYACLGGTSTAEALHFGPIED